ncbi:phage major head protein, partial [gut metagenome]
MANDVNRKLVGNNGSFSYDSVGNAEDLHDILININPNRTKFLSKFGTAEKAVSTNFNWFTERLRPPQDNAHLEKEDYTFSEIGTQEGLSNYIQHFQNSGFITDTQNSIK